MLHGHHMKKRLSKNKSDIYFVYPGNINAKTGGYIYEKNILEYAKIRDCLLYTSDAADDC